MTLFCQKQNRFSQIKRDREKMLETPIIFIAGPTASGKSQLAFELAKAIPGEIISVDSMKVFRGLDIGTAKPTMEEQNQVPYHLVDIQEPTVPFSMGRFVKLAEKAMAEIQARGRAVIFEGGTGLYLKAILWGVFEGPTRNERFRQKLEDFVAKHGTTSLHRRISQIDPMAANKIHTNDQKRLIRVLEVYLETGQMLSEQQQQFEQAPRFAHKMYALNWDRAELYDRINKRVLQMFEQGWVEEVRQLPMSQFCSEARMALGYREIQEYLDGKDSLENIIGQIQQKTRKFAKRQLTWFNNSFPQLQWLEAKLPLADLVSFILHDCQKNDSISKPSP